jgi:hypothetical protein
MNEAALIRRIPQNKIIHRFASQLVYIPLHPYIFNAIFQWLVS